MHVDAGRHNLVLNQFPYKDTLENGQWVWQRIQTPRHFLAALA